MPWIGTEFYLKLIQEFQRLKNVEVEKQNKHEKWLQNRWLTKINYKLHNEAIKDIILPIRQITKKDECRIYSNEGDMFNKIVFGITATEFQNKYPKNMRDFAEPKVLAIISNLESANANMLKQSITNQE